MDVSNKKGTELLDTVATLTGLPEDLVQNELQELVAAAGQDAGEVTLDQLRQAMLLYLETLAQQEESLMDGDSSIVPSA